jgi:membrane peptidoglycan carboxypeptidase
MSQSGRKTPKLVAENRYAGTKPAAKTSAPKSRAKRKPVRKRPTGPLGWIGRGIRWVVRLLFRLFWSIGVVACLIVAGAVVYTATTLPPVDDLIDGRARGSVTLLDATGAPFAWRGDQFGGMITADMVSPHLRNAVVATEDKRFYWHIGVSPRGIASAVRINLQAGRGALSGNGGSTITQQTAKLLCQGQPFDATIWDSEAAYEEDCRRTTIWRKATEAVYAMAMELRYTKDEILTLYLNRAYLGAGTRGFEAAAQRYFGISAAEVNPSQAAILAGLLKAPSTYAPTANLQRSWDRANVVLTLMEDQGYLTAAQTAEARTNPAQLSEAAEARAGGYFADWVMDTGPSYFTETTTEDVIIRTTLDQDIQSAAEEALAWVFENKVREGSEAQAAIVVMSADGAVRAMVGGRETKVAGVFNRATQALRQTGSLFKPFIYAAALELGHSPLELIVDEPLCLNVPGSGEWCPQNYDREFKGPITLTDALANSRNVPAVLLSEDVGREAVQTVARGFGMTGELADGPAIALGVTESTLVEMAGAYAGILNGGSSVVPYGLVELRLLGDDTSLMGSGGGIGERIIREESAQQLVWMMHQVVEAGSGMRARIDGWEIAGKSGTTQGARDAWFIGFTGDYVTAVWMGYDNNTPLTGVTGGGLPATIWHETMVRVLADKSPTPLPMIVPAPVEQPVTVNTGQQQGGGIIDNLLRDLLGGGQ